VCVARIVILQSEVLSFLDPVALEDLFDFHGVRSLLRLLAIDRVFRRRRVVVATVFVLVRQTLSR